MWPGLAWLITQQREASYIIHKCKTPLVPAVDFHIRWLLEMKPESKSIMVGAFAGIYLLYADDALAALAV